MGCFIKNIWSYRHVKPINLIKVSLIQKCGRGFSSTSYDAYTTGNKRHLLRLAACTLFNSGSLVIAKRSLSVQCNSCMQNQHKSFREEGIRFNGIRIQLHEADEWEEEDFEQELLASLKKWAANQRRSVFLEVPINLSHVIPIANRHGFMYHHARNNCAVLCKWLVENQESKIPAFANHQVGVAGACYREDTGELLVVQDKGRFVKWWKFPGGFSNIGEFIGDTAVREVFEETGVKAAFKSILSLRQQHDVFYGQSDLYFICRLNPTTYEITPCPDEIENCRWMKIDELLTMKDSTPFVKMTCRLFLKGISDGFDNVDMEGQEIESWVTTNKMMWIYHRTLEK